MLFLSILFELNRHYVFKFIDGSTQMGTIFLTTFFYTNRHFPVLLLRIFVANNGTMLPLSTIDLKVSVSDSAHFPNQI